MTRLPGGMMLRRTTRESLRVRLALLALPLLVAPGLAQAVDTYNAVTDQLNIAELHFGDATFTDMVVTPGTILGIAGWPGSRGTR